MNISKDEEIYSLTPWACLSATLSDYGINLAGITPKMGEHMVEDFMELMVKSGNVKRAEQKE